MEWLKSFDFSIPPPQLEQPRHWSATQAEIQAINQAISKQLKPELERVRPGEIRPELIS